MPCELAQLVQVLLVISYISHIHLLVLCNKSIWCNLFPYIAASTSFNCLSSFVPMVTLPVVTVIAKSPKFAGAPEARKALSVPLMAAVSIAAIAAVKSKSSSSRYPILNALRGGITITIIDIKPLKSRDVVELKRAISKIRKTIEAVEGNIAGFGENMVIATPAFAHLQKGIQQQEKKSEIERF